MVFGIYFIKKVIVFLIFTKLVEKKMCFKPFCLILLFLVIQKTSTAQSIGKRDIIDRSVNPGGIIDEFPPAPPKTIGSTYINDEWSMGSLVLFTSAILVDYPMKYDLKNEQLEINHKGNVKVCPLEKIKTFSWIQYGSSDSLHFVNSRYLSKVKKNNPETILNRLYVGHNSSLYKEYYLDLKEATYVPALDMGKKDNKILVKKTYYALIDNSFYKLNSSLKKNKTVFVDNYNSMESYQKKYKLKFKNEKDLIELLKYYDSIL